MHETAETMSAALNSLQRTESLSHAGAVGTSVSTEKDCKEGGGSHVLLDGVCLFVGKVPKKAERAIAAVPLEPPFG